VAGLPEPHDLSRGGHSFEVVDEPIDVCSRPPWVRRSDGSC